MLIYALMSARDLEKLVERVTLLFLSHQMQPSDAFEGKGKGTCV